MEYSEMAKVTRDMLGLEPIERDTRSNNDKTRQSRRIRFNDIAKLEETPKNVRGKKTFNVYHGIKRTDIDKFKVFFGEYHVATAPTYERAVEFRKQAIELYYMTHGGFPENWEYPIPEEFAEEQDRIDLQRIHERRCKKLFEDRLCEKSDF